jgi:hypothetical protein
MKSRILWLEGIVVSALLFGALPLYAQPSAEPSENFWQPDGPVYAIVATNGLVHLGGSFSYVGPVTGGAAVLGATSAERDKGFPAVLSENGEAGLVAAAAPDGNGGWFIAGNFTRVGGVIRSNLAHILNDNRIDSTWNPAPNGTNSSLAVVGNTVYVGGAFTRVGGQARNRLAALNAVSGVATAWNPNVNQPVLAISTAGNVVYIAGNFTTVGGQTRNRVAALDSATGQPTAWNPNANQIVSSVAAAGNIVYVGGNFTTIGGKPRNRIAALDAATGGALDWNPNASGVVSALAVGPDAIYAGGAFNAIGSENRSRFAALDPVTGLATPLLAEANGNVNTLLLSGTTLYLGGAFTTIGTESRRNVAALDTDFGVLSDWQAPASSLSTAATQAFTLATADDQLLVGGNFRSIGGVLRTNLAILNATTGEPTAWKPDANNTVLALAVTQDRVYAGGIFTAISGVPRNRLAALSPVNGAAFPWNPGVSGRANSSVNAILPSLSRVYIGGAFTNVAGTFRNSLAAVDAVTGQTVPWDPNAQALQTTVSASVLALLIDGDLLYAGGDFLRIGGQVRTRVAAISQITGQPTAFSVLTTNIVAALALKDNMLYVGGTFATLGGQVRNRIGAVDVASGQVSNWNPDVSGQGARVNSIAPLGGHLYVGGQFAQAGGEFRNRFAAVTLSNGKAAAWDPNLDNQVRTMQITPEAIYVGGDFLHIGGAPQSYFAVFSNKPAFDSLSVANGQFNATLRTGEGQSLRVQTSTDLVEWSDLRTESIADVAVPFSEPVITTPPSRFYRAVLQIAP